MSRRKKYQTYPNVYPGARVQEQSNDKGQMAIIRKVIEKWLDKTPSFRVRNWNDQLVIRDTVYDYRLAMIDFKYDHLIVSLPAATGLSWDTTGHFNTKHGYKVGYSDPDLHTRIKYLVNKSYDQQEKWSNW